MSALAQGHKTLPASVTPKADTVPLADSLGKLDVGWMPATINADTLDGLHAATSGANAHVVATDSTGRLTASYVYSDDFRINPSSFFRNIGQLGSRSLFPLQTGLWADRFQFGNVESLEYSTDGSTWNDWSSQLANMQRILSGYPNNPGFLVNSASFPRWRFVISNTFASYAGLLLVHQEYYNTDPHPYNITLEGWENDTWNTYINNTSVPENRYFAYFFTGATFSLKYRVTINQTSPDIIYRWSSIRYFSDRVNGQGGQVLGLPFSWGYDKTVSLTNLKVAGKVGFYNTTPVEQPTLATGTGATVDDVITALQALGLVKQS